MKSNDKIKFLKGQFGSINKKLNADFEELAEYMDTSTDRNLKELWDSFFYNYHNRERVVRNAFEFFLQKPKRKNKNKKRR